MRYKLLLLALIIVLFSTSAYARECESYLSPGLLIDDYVELYEDSNYLGRLTEYPMQEMYYFDINSTFPNFFIERNASEINFTPSLADLGAHKILFLAIDSNECYSSKLVDFYVYDRPRITPLKPDTNYIEIQEGQNILFIADVMDKDNDVKDYSWYINGNKENASSKEKFPFITKYNFSGIYNITVLVTDNKKLNDSYTWKVNVKDQNRNPYLFSGLPDYAAEEKSKLTIGPMTNYFMDPDSDILEFEINAKDKDGNTIDISAKGDGENRITFTIPDNFIGLIMIEIAAKDRSGAAAKSDSFVVTVFGNQSVSYSIKEFHVCGDGVCGGNETCSNCYSDCGPCTQGQNRCENDWSCNDWSKCYLPGYMVRECSDKNGCFDQTRKPVTAQICAIEDACFDMLLDNGEIKVDCGGPCKPCPTCKDFAQNQGEEGVDCGGPCDRPCPTCHDNIQNQLEADIDCGGPCSPCNDEKKCIYWSDCKSHICEKGFCAIPTCSDGVKNQDEHGADCEGICGGVCPNCFDKIKNQGEEGVDCGGPCSPCESCSDGIKNQDEFFTDCGGPCSHCGWGDFKKNSPINMILFEIFVIAILISGLGYLGFFWVDKIFFTNDLNRLLAINRMQKSRKKLFLENKGDIDETYKDLDEYRKNPQDLKSSKVKEDIVFASSKILDTIFEVSITNDDKYILEKIQEKKVKYPLDRIILHYASILKDIKQNNYTSDMEMASKIEKLLIILDEMKKET